MRIENRKVSQKALKPYMRGQPPKMQKPVVPLIAPSMEASSIKIKGARQK